MTGSLIVQELRFQFRHGFGLAYFFIILVYLGGLHLLPPVLLPVVLALLILTDPMSVGLIFVGGVIQLENAMQLVPALFVTPLSPARFLANRATAFSLLGGAIALALLVLAPESGFSRAPFSPAATAVLLTLLMALSSTVLTLLGAAAGYLATSINGFILLIVPLLLLTALPLLGWIPAISQWWFFWAPSFIPTLVTGALLGVTPLPGVPLLLLGGALFLLWGWGAARSAAALLERRLRLTVGGMG